MIDWNNIVAPRLVAPMSSQAQHNAWSYKPAVSMSSELRRVLGLPRRALELDGTERAETMIDMQTELFGRVLPQGARCHCAELDDERFAADGHIERLRLPQAQALREIAICGGLLAPIGVGWGKTLIDLLAPLAFRRYSDKLNTFILLVPPGLAEQLENDYRYYGQHFKMPQIVFHGNVDYANTCQKMDPWVVLERGAPVLHVVPYSNLSRPESTSWIERELRPDVVIADEAHKLRNAVPPRQSATGGRVWRYMEEVAPHTLFASLTGSMTAKSVSDYWHLAKWSLRGGSPVPIVQEVKDDWCRALNPSDNPADPGPLLQLCAPGEHLYDGFKRRVAETAGVVTTAAPAVDVALVLVERSAPPLPREVINNLKMVRGLLPDQPGPQRPDGREFVTALEVHECCLQVACGFYYKDTYPDCVFPRDNDLVDEWNTARKELARELRQKLKNPEEHLDSPRLLLNAAERFHDMRPRHKGLPEWKSLTIKRWYAVKTKVRTVSKAVWFSDYLVNDAIEWAHEHRGLIWYDQATVGKRIAQLSGLPCFGGGKDAKRAMLGDQRRGIVGEDGSRSIIVSIPAHGTGTNGLQHRFHEALTINPMSSPDGWEQHVGRLHRPGQKFDVKHEFYRHTDELKRHVDSALRAANYVEATGFGHQKIIHAFEVE